MTTVTHAGADFFRAPQGPGAKARVKGARWVLVALGLLVGIVVIGVITRTDTDSIPMSIHNPGPLGTRALAQVAEDHGVDVRQIDELVKARITDPESTTLVIGHSTYMQGYQAQSVLAYPGPIVVLGDGSAVARAASRNIYWGSTDAAVLDAACENPDATAAGTIKTSGPIWVSASEPSETCFPTADGAVMVVVPRDDKGDVTLIADPGLATNESITGEGNAALMLRLIGGLDNVVWYTGSLYDTTVLTWTGGGTDTPKEFDDVQPSTDFLPPGTGNALYALGLALVIVAWWRARRFGAIVHEPLPVVVRAAETTRGRARMYRAARASGRAAASLRAAAALRMGQRVGVPRSADHATLIAAVANASGRTSAYVEETLFGPPPQTEAEMMTLLSRIDTLENEVHRS